MKNISIQTVLLALLTLTVLVTIISAIVSAFSVSKNNIIDLRLEDNLAYAKKVANMTNNIVLNMQKSLAVTAIEVEQQYDNIDFIRQSLQKAAKSNNYFNSVVYLNQKGFIQAAVPDIGIVGTYGVPESMEDFFSKAKNQSLISPPFLSLSNNLLVMVTVPVRDEKGITQGIIGGTVYLEGYNIISKTLGDHSFNNTGYVYVVDQLGKLIYHPRKERLNENVSINEVVERVRYGDSGSQIVTNTEGIKMIAGYAPISLTGWGVVSQIPLSSIDNYNLLLIKRMLRDVAPFIIFLLILSLLLIKRIIGPITELANFSRSTLSHKHFEKPIIVDSFYEIVQLKNAVFLSMDYFNGKMNNLEIESKTDSLTGLLNRRAYDQFLSELVESNRPFSLVAFDIDHFKKVNDEFGHLQGDTVLRSMAEIIMREIRGADKAFRCGGEEFSIVLPDIELPVAEMMSERIRKKIANTPTPIGKNITISMGVGYYTCNTDTLDELLRKTDKALYKAKENGRNRVEIVA